MLAKNLQDVSLEEFDAMQRDERFNYELLDGVVLMSPRPSKGHQEILTNIFSKLLVKLTDVHCKLLSEVELRFVQSVCVPDLSVFCDKDNEFPEIVIEILSPSNRRHDTVTKVIKYEEMGIKEYWIVDPKIKSITVHNFIDGTTEAYGVGDVFQSNVIPEIIISVTDIFDGWWI